MKKEMARLKKLEVRLLDASDKQLSLTDPDARSMNSRGTGMVGEFSRGLGHKLTVAAC